MSPDSSFHEWLVRVGEGDEEAIRTLWDGYFADLVRVARRRLQDIPRRVRDEEDVVLSVFDSFCDAAAQGRFPNLRDRAGLWRLLSQMTRRKVVDLIRQVSRERVRGDSVFSPGTGSDDRGISAVAAAIPTPLMADVLEESCRTLLDQLQDDDLRSIALAKLDGCPNTEIARRHDCSVATIERRLNLIRRKWEHHTRLVDD